MVTKALVGKSVSYKFKQAVVSTPDKIVVGYVKTKPGSFFLKLSLEIKVRIGETTLIN